MHKCDHLSVSICALSEWCKRPSSSINSKIYSSFSLNIPNYKFYVVSLLVLGLISNETHYYKRKIDALVITFNPVIALIGFQTTLLRSQLA